MRDHVATPQYEVPGIPVPGRGCAYAHWPLVGLARGRDRPACRLAGHPPVRPGLRDHGRGLSSDSCSWPSASRTSRWRGSTCRCAGCGLSSAVLFLVSGVVCFSDPNGHVRRSGRHARVPLPDRRSLVDSSCVPGACAQFAVVDGARRRESDDGARVLDLRPVLHRRRRTCCSSSPGSGRSCRASRRSCGLSRFAICGRPSR